MVCHTRPLFLSTSLSWWDCSVPFRSWAFTCLRLSLKVQGTSCSRYLPDWNIAGEFRHSNGPSKCVVFTTLKWEGVFEFWGYWIAEIRRRSWPYKAKHSSRIRILSRTKVSVRNSNLVKIADRLLRIRTIHFYSCSKYLFIIFSIQAIGKSVAQIRGKNVTILGINAWLCPRRKC